MTRCPTCGGTVEERLMVAVGKRATGYNRCNDTFHNRKEERRVLACPNAPAHHTPRKGDTRCWECGDELIEWVPAPEDPA